MDPLEGLDEVPWHALNHAYGPATDVPRLLRALASESPEARWDAFMHLHANIYHQGTVYEATPYAVPFLIRLFEAPETPEREPVALLLVMIGNGWGWLEGPATTTRHLHKRLLRAGTSYEKEQERSRRIAEEARALVAPVLPRVIAALPAFAGRLRTSILYTLAEYPANLPTLEPILETIRQFEDEAAAEPYWQQIIDYLINSCGG
ncbi:hypothetical protein [Armatimonas rosea]|uniref:HEAT repeat protein n=1 Tax=Armatimonas rosea TaxID=685828 RepID=A0A7W9SS45_ARMRO|nr:hypothetical protein [Armatimonas rosea]MBB6051830.1 hypothetical protein [Armatimonas rosea]